MAKVKLTACREGFRKCVGKHVGKGGTLKKKIWYLGDHPRTAERRAEFIKGQWKELKAQGVDHWTDDAIARVEAYNETGDEQVALVARPVPKVPVPSKKVLRTLTTHQMVDLFSDQYGGSGAGRNTILVNRRTLKMLKEYVPDEPMTSVDALRLERYIGGIVSLPPSKRTGKPLKTRTAKNLVLKLKRVFDFADKTEQWVAPKRFHDVFRNKVKVKTEARQYFDQFHIRELWRAADERQRLYLLLMLNCGFTAVDIAELLYDLNRDFSTDSDRYGDGETFVYVHENWDVAKLEDWERFDGWRIAGKRTKTSVFGVFPLWVDTAKALSSLIQSNGKGRVFQEDLIKFGEVSRIDYIGRSLDALIRDVSRANKCPDLPPKVLRKTGAQMIRDIAGLEVSQVYLRHTDTSVAGRHYNQPSYDALANALQVMRERLDIAFR